MRRGLILMLAASLSIGTIALPALPLDATAQARALATVEGLGHADDWSSRFLALAPWFDPNLQAALAFHEARPIAAIVEHLYQQLGPPWTRADGPMVQVQVDALPSPVDYALQQLLGAIDASITDWHAATAAMTPQDWDDLHAAGAGSRFTMTPAAQAALDKIDGHRLHASALRLLATVDDVTPVLQAWQPDPRLNDCDLGVNVAPGPNDCVWFHDPYSFIMVGGLGNSVYRGNSWPATNIDRGEHLFILEPGGNDFYYNHAASAHPWPRAGVCLGTALPPYDCAQGFPVSLVLDIQGNDVYEPSPEGTYDDAALGHGYDAGIGILVDALGDDFYHGDEWSQNSIGAADFYGIGLLLDASGDDAYLGAASSEGVGNSQALGLLLDVRGNDRYYGPDSFSQATSAWGTGILADLGGNDFAGGGFASQGRAFGGGNALFLNVGGSDAYQALNQVRGWAGTCWQSGWLPPCPMGMPDFLAVFMDVCGTGRDLYLTNPGVDGTSWQQNSYGFGFDINVPVAGCAAYE